MVESNISDQEFQEPTETMSFENNLEDAYHDFWISYDDEKLDKWRLLARDLYQIGHNNRQINAHENAIIWYDRSLQVALDTQRILNNGNVTFKDDLERIIVQRGELARRLVSCRYQIVSSYNQNQSNPDKAMKELFELRVLLFDILQQHILPDLKEFFKENVDLQNNIKALDPKANNDVDMFALMEFIEAMKDKLGDVLENFEQNQEVISWLWKYQWLFTMYAAVEHDFYIECTSLLKKVENLDKLYEKACAMGLFFRAKIPADLIKNDPSEQSQFFAQLTDHWLSTYSDILVAETALATGDYTTIQQRFNEDYFSQLWSRINNRKQLIKEGKSYPEAIEHTIDILSRAYFAESYFFEERYPHSLEQLDKLYQIACEEQFFKIAIKIKSLQAQAAIKYASYQDRSIFKDISENLFVDLEGKKEILKMASPKEKTGFKEPKRRSRRSAAGSGYEHTAIQVSKEGGSMASMFYGATQLDPNRVQVNVPDDEDHQHEEEEEQTCIFNAAAYQKISPIGKGKYLEEARKACEEGSKLFSEIPAEKLDAKQTNLYKRWFDIVGSWVELLKVQPVIEVENASDSISLQIEKYINQAGTQPEKDSLKTLRRLEALLNDQLTGGNNAEKRVVINRLQEAQKYFLLGKIAFEKAKIFGDELKTLRVDDPSKVSEYVREKITCFSVARGNLCKAYNILKEMGYKDDDLYDEIALTYLAMLDYNYDITEVSKPERVELFKRMFGLKVNEKDRLDQNLIDQNVLLSLRSWMDRVTKDFHLQEWVDSLFTLIEKFELTGGDTYKSALAQSLENVAKIYSQFISKVMIAEKNGQYTELYGQLAPDKQEIFLEALEKAGKKDEKGPQEFDFYYKDNGKIVTIVPVDEKNQLVIESDIHLTDQTKGLLGDISSGIKTLFELNSLHSKMDDLMPEEEQLALIQEILFKVIQLNNHLLRKHPSTIDHALRMKRIMEKVVNSWNKANPKFKISTAIMPYLVHLHDIGKSRLDAELILNKLSNFLPFERAMIEQHVQEGIKILKGLLGTKNFSQFIAMAGGHHVKYGLDRGYPVQAVGDEIRMIPEQLKLDPVTLSDEEAFLARLISIIDVTEALTSTTRDYRKPMTKDELMDYLKSRAGRDFDPCILAFVVDLIKNNDLDNLLGFKEKTKEKSDPEIQAGDDDNLHDLITDISQYTEANVDSREYLNTFFLDDVIEFMQEFRDDLNTQFMITEKMPDPKARQLVDIPWENQFQPNFDEIRRYLKQAQGKGVAINLECVIAIIREHLMKKFDTKYSTPNEKDFGLGVMKKNEPKQYWKHIYRSAEQECLKPGRRDYVLSKFKKWASEREIWPIQETEFFSKAV